MLKSKVSQTIHEDEELEEGEEEADEQEEKPVVVPVSRVVKYDPRVFCEVDPPSAVFRIKLVCTILDTVSSHIVSVSNKTKIELILASLQRYLFVKPTLPSDGKCILFISRLIVWCMSHFKNQLSIWILSQVYLW